jgi:hypothetical protein
MSLRRWAATAGITLTLYCEKKTFKSCSVFGITLCQQTHAQISSILGSHLKLEI